MGTSAGNEQIAIAITTTSDTSGATAARTEVNALAQATTAATNEVIAATNRAAQSENLYAGAIANASTATEAEIALRTRFNELMAENGNNMQRVAAILLEERAAAEAASQAATQHAEAVQVETTALAEVTQQATQEATALRTEATADEAATISANELVVATEAKSAAMATAVAQTSKIPGSARTAANAVGILAQSAVAGTGSMAGLATAAGGLAYGIGTLVPSIAGAAAGIGALVTLGITLYNVLEKDADAASHFKAALGGIGTESSAQLKIQRDALQREFDALTEQAANLGRLSPIEGPKILAKQKEVSNALNKINAQVLDAEKRENDERVRDAQRTADEIARIRAQDAQKAATLGATMAEETQSAIDRATLSDEAVAEAHVVRQERAREAEIRALQINEDEKTTLLLAAQADRDAQLHDIHKKAEDKQNKEEQDARDRAEKAGEEALLAMVKSGVDAAVKSQGGYIDAMTKAFLTPIEKALEGEAEHQLALAAASAAAGNFVGAAEHAGVAALAIAGARKVAAIGGLNSSGGGGGSSAGGYGGGSTFTPNQQPAGGTTVINLITKDPYGRESIQQVSYLMQRNGTLNVPIYPPTAGLVQA